MKMLAMLPVLAADFAAVALIADQQRDALFHLRKGSSWQKR